MKGEAVTNAITIVGLAAVGALMFTQIPGVIDEIQFFLSKTSVILKASEIADLLTQSSSSPADVKITYKLPDELSYTVFIKDGIVNVSTDDDWAVSKTTSSLCFLKVSEDECVPAQVKTLMITKTIIEKVE